MAKKLGQMTTEEVKQEMSIAGSPDKIVGIMHDVLLIIAEKVDHTNAAELINMELALRRVAAEVKLTIKRLGKRTGQKL